MLVVVSNARPTKSTAGRQSLEEIIHAEPGRELNYVSPSRLPDAPDEVAISWYSDEEFAAISDDLYVPQRFWGDWRLTRGDLRVVLEIVLEHGRLACDMVHVRRGQKSNSLDTATIRALNLTSLIDATAALASFVRPESGDDELPPAWQGFTLWVSRADDDLSAWRQKTSRTPRRGKAVSDDELRRVAAIYRTAVARRQPPTKTVATEMHVARSTAGRWVVEARKRGFLGPAPPPGLAGELEPSTTRRKRARVSSPRGLVEESSSITPKPQRRRKHG